MTLPYLITLQAADLELRRLRAELAELPKRTAAAQAGRAAAAGTLASAQKKLADEDALRRRQELDIAAHKSKVERLTRQTDAATSTAQVNALANEMEFTRKAIATLEEEEFASMERTEELEASLGKQQSALVTADTALTRAQAIETDTTARHNASLQQLETERTKLRTSLLNPPADWPATSPESPAALALYDRIARGKGTGLAEAVPDTSGGGQCSACRMRVRPQRWQDITSREHAGTIFTCETCGRVLFFDGRRNAPGTAPEIDRLHAALAAEPVKR